MIIRCLFFFFKQKSAYEMRISDWSSDVCSSDLSAGLAVWRRCRRHGGEPVAADRALRRQRKAGRTDRASDAKQPSACGAERGFARHDPVSWTRQLCQPRTCRAVDLGADVELRQAQARSEEHTSELQSLI